MKISRILVLLSCLCIPAVTSADYLEVRRATDVYTKPLRSSEKVAHIEPSDQERPYLVPLLAEEKVNGYYKVRLPGRRAEGWIYKTYVRRHSGQQPGRPDERNGEEEAGPVSARELEMHLIDVGQGDSTLLVCPNGKTVLVDAGSSADGSLEDIKDYIHGQLGMRKKKIDTLIVTHPDSDHYNLLPDVLRGVQVKRVILVGEEEDYSEKFWEWLQGLGVPQRQLDEKAFDPPELPNSQIDCGKAEVFVLAAAIPATRKATNFIKNSLSIVVMVRYGEFDAILTGDATFDTENAILGRFPREWLRAEVLKIGHHGSRVTSTAEAWARVVQPEVAIASAGPRSSHGHPSEEVVKRLESFTKPWRAHPMSYAKGKKPYTWRTVEDYKEAIFSTAASGTIVVTSDGKTYDIKTVQIDE